MAHGNVKSAPQHIHKMHLHRTSQKSFGILKVAIYTWALLMMYPTDTYSKGLAIAGSLGGTVDSTKSMSFAWSAMGYYKWDEMVLLGVEGGAQQNSYPWLASGYLRFPFGRVLMPMVTGGIGVVYTKGNTPFAYRWGAGFDWKNGQYSSLLIYGGSEEMKNGPAWYGRAGLLLEF